MPAPRALLPLLALVAVLATGCRSGTIAYSSSPGALPSASESPSGTGANAVATKNTTRLGGATPVDDAAAVAEAVYPGLTPPTRPPAVVLASESDWEAALSASVLMSAPVRAPLLFTDGTSLPSQSAQALAALHPSGAKALSGAQVIRVGNVASPGGLKSYSISGSGPFALSAKIAELEAGVRGSPTNAVMVASSASPEYAMPAAGYAAEAGVPLLFVTPTTIPAATRAALATLQSPTIFVVGPGPIVSEAIVGELRDYGTVHRVRGEDPVSNAINFARYSRDGFGWGINTPGHGLVFIDEHRTLDAAAAAPLSASGDYGPLLLLDSSENLAPALIAELLNIQPGYEAGTSEPTPVESYYNHGWLIGDASAISPLLQAKIDDSLQTIPSSGVPTQ